LQRRIWFDGRRGHLPLIPLRSGQTTRSSAAPTIVSASMPKWR
jgi:hypothetical protein